jgi:hypothetical protein
MHPQLEDLQRQFDSALARARSLEAMDERAFTAPPPGGGWSVAQCLGHLSLTARALLPRLTAAVEQGGRDAVRGTGPFSRGLVGAALAWSLEPPSRLRSRTPASFEPLPAAGRAEVLTEFAQAHEALLACLRQADGLDLNRLRIASPFAERLQYNLYAAFCIAAAHARRHLWQAERVVAR